MACGPLNKAELRSLVKICICLQVKWAEKRKLISLSDSVSIEFILEASRSEIREYLTRKMLKLLK